MSQDELADAVGVYRKSVSNWETGKTTPRNRLGALERVLGVALAPGDIPRHAPVSRGWSVDLTDLEGPDLTPLERKLIEQAAFTAAADKRAALNIARKYVTLPPPGYESVSRTRRPIGHPEEAGRTGPVDREGDGDATAIAEAKRELADDLEGERAVLDRIEADLARLKASTQAAQDRPDVGADRSETGGHRSGPENTTRVER